MCKLFTVIEIIEHIRAFLVLYGAGRWYSRNKATELFTTTDLAVRMEGIVYRPGEEWVDEIPDAYKDIDTVMADSGKLVTVRHKLWQVLNVKGT